MQQAWRYRLWGTGRLSTVQGKTVRVLDPGKLNNGPGPDFYDARISVEGVVLAGCVEMHRYASDWHSHGHDNDRRYDNVILHVVADDDCRIHNDSGEEIMQTVMRIDNKFVSVYNTLLTSRQYVLPMCGSHIDDIEHVFQTDWLTALTYERMLRKAEDVKKRLDETTGDWLTAAFVTLARGFGFGTNADNMERLARTLPYKTMMRHADRIEAVEAMLFGQASLLNHSHPADEYEAMLAREYKFYAIKYGLTPIDSPIWGMNVRNTGNSPYRRIAVLARIVQKYGVDLGSRLTSISTTADAHSFLDIDENPYWRQHYAFGRSVSNRQTALGKQSRDLLVINVLAPLLYARGLQTARIQLLDAAMCLWEETAPEQNAITRGFDSFGIKATSASVSQALIQLHREYCERRRCASCRLGHRIMSQYITFPTNPKPILQQSVCEN